MKIIDFFLIVFLFIGKVADFIFSIPEAILTLLRGFFHGRDFFIKAKSGFYGESPMDVITSDMLKDVTQMFKEIQFPKWVGFLINLAFWTSIYFHYIK